MEEKKYTLNDVEELRSRTGISYEEAVGLLEKYDGDIAKALVELEKLGQLPRKEKFEGAEFGERVVYYARKWWKIGCETRIVLERKDRKLCDLCILYVILAVLLSWKLAAVSAILALVLGCKVRMETQERTEKADKTEKAAQSAEPEPVVKPEEDKKDDDGFSTVTIE